MGDEGLGCEETPVHVELTKKNARKGSTQGTVLGVGVGEEVTTVGMAPSSQTPSCSFKERNQELSGPPLFACGLDSQHLLSTSPCENTKKWATNIF